MRRDLERRLSRLEETLILPRSCTVIRVGGGVPGEELAYAFAGVLRLRRGSYEPLDIFERRVIDAAEEAGVAFVVIGGLPEPDDGNVR